MKKIGIVSIFRTGNYGGTLQAYALVKAINDNKLGQAETINYCCDAIKGRINIKYLKKAGPARTVAALVDKACYMPRMKKMNGFIDSFVQGPELTKADLAALNERYDVFLSGSDQLWNPDIQQDDYFYLQDFVTDANKKRSYASSFGKKELPESYKTIYRELLGNFRTITVREKAGANIVERLIGTRPSVVLDPTLLLTAQQWEAILPPRIMRGAYVFIYRLTYSPMLTQAAIKAQQEMGGSVMAVPFLMGHCPKQKMYPNLDSLEWVRGIHDANYVVTDSFHGVVFSILFSRPFYYLVTTSTARERISRLETLLESIGLSDRIVENTEACDFKKKIDYTAVQQNLQKQRERSLHILENLLA